MNKKRQTATFAVSAGIKFVPSEERPEPKSRYETSLASAWRVVLERTIRSKTRQTMRFATAAAMAMIATGCAGSFSPLFAFPITKQRAIQIASAELEKREIIVSPEWPIDVTEDVCIVEFAPEVPIYVVEFRAPGGKFGFPRYTVSIYKFGGLVQYFSDSATLRRADRAPVHPKE